MTRRAVLAWAKEMGDTIGLHRNYVRMTGDLGAGATLSQILYWFDDGKDGAQRARVERDGETWIAKSPDELAVELGLEDDDGAPRGKVARRYVQNLEDEGLVITAVFKFAGQRCLHIRPLWAEIERRKQAIIARAASAPTEAAHPNSRLGNSESVTSTDGNLVPGQMPDSGFANDRNGNLLSTKTTGIDYSSESTEEGGACAPDAPSPSAVDEVCAALAAWARLDLASAGEQTRSAFESLATVQAAAGVDAAYVRYCDIRWYEEHWAGRDTNRPMAKRRPANTRQLTDWIATCLCDAKPGDRAVEARLAGFHHGPLYNDAQPTLSHAAPIASNAAPTPDATAAAEWPEPRLAPLLEALGYTPADCPPGERLAADKLLAMAFRRGLSPAEVVEVARRIAPRLRAGNVQRVRDAALEVDAMVVTS